jgi:hypothetical protein
MKTLSLTCLGAVLAACGSPPPATPWFELFDGETLGQFAITEFGGQGPIRVAAGRLELGAGSPLTGVTWVGPPPHGTYELELVIRRDDGTDFFCGLTFPVRDAHLTLVLGGWGGSVSGLSSLDGKDASHNETRTLRHFETGRDYTIHLRVARERVFAFVDEQPFLDADLTGRSLSLRPEVLLNRPLGLATFATAASLRSMRWRPLRECG